MRLPLLHHLATAITNDAFLHLAQRHSLAQLLIIFVASSCLSIQNHSYAQENVFSLAPYNSNSQQVAYSLPGVTTPTTQDQEALALAKAVWEHYQALELAYNPALADVYSNDATVQIQHLRGDEQITEVIPANQYQQALRQLMAVAQNSGDTSLYEGATFKPKGQWVIVQATRVDGRTGYRLPHWVTIQPDASNALGGRIVAEVAVVKE